MRLMQRLEERLDVIEGDRERDPSDVSEDKESQDKETATQESTELRMLKQVFGSTLRLNPDVLILELERQFES